MKANCALLVYSTVQQWNQDHGNGDGVQRVCVSHVEGAAALTNQWDIP